MKQTELRTIVDKVNKALAIIAKEHGMISLKVAGNVRFEGSAQDVTAFKVPVAAIVTEAKVTNDLQLLGFPADTLGREVSIGGKTYKITGVNLKKSKFGVQVVDVATGKPYGFDTNHMLQILAPKPNLTLTNH